MLQKGQQTMTEQALQARRAYKNAWAKAHRRIMTEEQRQANREYKNAWARKNREKVKASQERYWERVAAKLREEAERQQQGNNN